MQKLEDRKIEPAGLNDLAAEFVRSNPSLDLRLHVEAAKKFLQFQDGDDSSQEALRLSFRAAMMCSLGSTLRSDTLRDISQEEFASYFYLVKKGYGLGESEVTLDKYRDSATCSHRNGRYSIRFLGLDNFYAESSSLRGVATIPDIDLSGNQIIPMAGSFGIALCYRGEVCAFVTSIPHGSIGTLFINQIQGIPASRLRYPSALRGVNWKEYLVDTQETIATLVGFSHVGILSSSNQNIKLDFPLDRARMIYDKTAELCGFSPDADGNYLKEL